MSNARHVLVVGCEPTEARGLASALERVGIFSCHSARTAADAWGALMLAVPRTDALLVEALLPDGCAWDLCTRMQRAGLRIPVIILSQKVKEADVVRGLESGAVDWLRRPFAMSVLLARLRAHLRAYDETVDAVLPIGSWLFHPGRKLLVDQASKHKVRLTAKESVLLQVLARNPSRTLSRIELLDRVWGVREGVHTHTVEAHIYRLRSKVERDPSDPHIVIANGNGGYFLGDGSDGMVSARRRKASSLPRQVLPDGTGDTGAV